MVVDESLDFTFSQGQIALQLDETTYYLKKFQKIPPGTKCVDIAAYEVSTQSLWLVEVKDYSRHRRQKDITLSDEVAIKVRDSLALIFAGSTMAGVPEERLFFQELLTSKKIRIACHCELPSVPSRLFGSPIDLTDLQDKLRQCLRSIDYRVLAVNTRFPGTVPWQVKRV